MKAEKRVSIGGMELSSREVIPELESDKSYKYLGILEANDIMHTDMKDKIQTEYQESKTADIIEIEWWKYNQGNKPPGLYPW